MKYQQTMKLPSGGSLFNWMMSNNNSTPVPGQYATIMHYSDRDVVIVREFDQEKGEVLLEVCDTQAAAPNQPMGHQNWKHIPTGRTYKIRWYRGKWRTVSKSIVFTDEFKEKVDMFSVAAWLRKNNPELFDEIYQGDVYPQKVIPGITREKTSYEHIRILFGKDDYYYDWSF